MATAASITAAPLLQSNALTHAGLPASRHFILRTSGRRGSLRCEAEKEGKGRGSGLSLGPIGLTLGGDLGERADGRTGEGGASKSAAEQANRQSGISLGPIGLTLGGDLGEKADGQVKGGYTDGEEDEMEQPKLQSIASMTTEEWRALYEPSGRVNLWVEEEFNAGSRLMGGRAVHKGSWAGRDSGEGRPSPDSDAPEHTVRIYSQLQGKEFEVQVPEDRYILWEAEDQGLELPYACRMGCCTSCAVKVTEGEVEQYQALGVSKALREAGYALMCVAYPLSDCRLETVEEDEVYDLQFGQAFRERALNPNSPAIERDDFALEIANMDE